MPKNIGIIGSGFGGLSAAIYLARAGHHVTVYEKHSQLGGRARILEDQGFRRDMGPSRYLMPDIFENTFNDWGIDINKELRLQQLDPSYRVRWPDSDLTTDVHARREQNKDFFESLEPGSRDRLVTFLDRAKDRYNLTVDKLLSIPFESVWTLMRHAIPALKVNAFGGLRSEISKSITHPTLQSLLEYTMVFIGTAPADAPGMYSIMAHVDAGLGVWYPDGGIRAVVDLMIRIAEESGVTFCTDHEISRIDVVDGVAQSLVSQHGTHIHDHIISNADMPWTETQLLPKEAQTYPASYWDCKILAPSTYLLYLGVKGSVDNLLHHNLIFRDDWDGGFEKIFGRGHTTLPQNPSIYICCPSKTDDAVAPEGYENLFVLVPTPTGVYPDAETSKQYRDHVLQQIEETIGTSFVDRIVVEHEFHAQHFADAYHSYEGTALGLAHTLRQSAYRRPHLTSQKVKNLSYCGAWTQPGIGMPMCLLSGKMVSGMV